MKAFAERLHGRLDRLGMEPEDLAAAAGLSVAAMKQILDGDADLPRGKKLQRLADAVSTSVAYLLGLDPDADVPEEYLREDQGALGLLAIDEEALLRAYRRLDVSSRSALLLVATRMSPEPEQPVRTVRRSAGRS